MGKSKDIAWVQVDIDPKNESVVCCKHCKANERIGNPAGIGKGTGFELRERDRDGIGLGHYRLRASSGKWLTALGPECKLCHDLKLNLFGLFL